MKQEITVFYDPRQSISDVNSFSPSAGKPARFMEALKSQAICHDIMPVVPATREDLYLVHDWQYVDEVFAGVKNNGFENNDPRVPQACLWTVGSMVSAVAYASRAMGPVCSPSSGFHHAGYGWGGGYCTFNGLMVAAAKFILANPQAKVGILDLDWHYGDGTDNILKNKPALAKRVLNLSSGKYFFDSNDDVSEFWAWLQGAILELNRFDCDVVIYQAGADMHIKDPLGGLLNDAEMARRDRIVFREINAPLVFNLAGGYRGDKSSDGLGNPVLRTHLNTVLEAIANKGGLK